MALVVVTQADKIDRPSAATLDLARIFRMLSSADRLAVLRTLLAGPHGLPELQRTTGLAEGALRRHLRILRAAGLVRSSATAEGEQFNADPAAIALLNATIVQQFSGNGRRLESLSGSPAGQGLNVYALDVPAPPSACLTCGNAAFVRRVLDDLDNVLTEARQYHGRLQQLSSQVLTAHEAERKRIARELHDDTGQALTSILVRLRLLERSVNDETVRKNVEELRELTGNALDSVRRMAVDLRPSALDDLGLVPALHSYTEKYSQAWPISVSFSAEGLKRRLPPNTELVLYRVVQEALTNVAKHSGARFVEVKLRRRSNVVTVTVRDDGRGFDLQKVTRTEGAGLGLFGMRERLALVGGTLEIESTPGRGTTVTARVPLTGREHRHVEGD